MNRLEDNTVLAERLLDNRDIPISPITSGDRDLYRHFFAGDNQIACYGNSWIYITQACRGFGLGLKYCDGEALYSIGCHRGHCVLVRPLGIIDERIIGLLEVLYSISGKPIFIKKLFPEQVSTLRNLAEFEDAIRHTSQAEPKPGNYPWDAMAFADDDTYPELILDTSISCDYVTPSAEWWEKLQRTWMPPLCQSPKNVVLYNRKKFRQKIHRFLRETGVYRLRSYCAEDATAMRSFLQSYFGPDRKGDIEAYENMLALDTSGVRQEEIFSLVAYLNDDPAPKAFFLAEQLDTQSAGLYAGIASRTHIGLIQYMYAQMIDMLQEAGIALLNLGGSENRGLNTFKHRLTPVSARYMHMLVYRGGRKRSIPIDTKLKEPT